MRFSNYYQFVYKLSLSHTLLSIVFAEGVVIFAYPYHPLIVLVYCHHLVRWLYCAEYVTQHVVSDQHFFQ